MKKMKSFPVITVVSSAVLVVGVMIGIVSGQQGAPVGQRSQYYNPADRDARIVRYDNVNNGDGNYQYSYETSNGIAAEEAGFLKNPGTNNEIQTARGSYQYYGPEGQLYRIVYTADENGFQAQGDHLPTPPPIPPEIQKSLDIIYANARNQQATAGQQPAYQQQGRQPAYQQQGRQPAYQQQQGRQPAYQQQQGRQPSYQQRPQGGFQLPQN